MTGCRYPSEWELMPPREKIIVPLLTASVFLLWIFASSLFLPFQLARTALTFARSSAPSGFIIRVAVSLLPRSFSQTNMTTWQREAECIRSEDGRWEVFRYSVGLIPAAFAVSLDHWRYAPSVLAQPGTNNVTSVAVKQQRTRNRRYRTLRIVSVLTLFRVASAILGFGFWTYLGWLILAIIGNYLYETLRK
jgi:uncharacterized membrane protein